VEILVLPWSRLTVSYNDFLFAVLALVVPRHAASARTLSLWLLRDVPVVPRVVPDEELDSVSRSLRLHLCVLLCGQVLSPFQPDSL
jgi:hypothetical protein